MIEAKEIANKDKPKVNGSGEKDEPKLRFSNYRKMLFLSFIPWIVIFITLQVEGAKRNYDSLLDLNNDLSNFLWILIGGLFFTSMGMTSTSFYASNYLSSLDKLTQLIPKEEKENWYQHFIDDVNAKRWILIYVLPILIIGSILHYIIYGHFIVEVFGWVFYGITLVAMLWSNLFIIIWLGWFVLAQYFHIYKFTPSGNKNNKEGYLLIGKPESTHYILNRILPRVTKPTQINVDIFNVDNLGGLNPLAQLSLSGTLLIGVVFATLVPVVVVANLTAAIILVPISFLVIIAGYVIGIGSLRDAIRKEKLVKLSSINNKLSTLASQIMNSSVSKPLDAEIQNLKNMNDQFVILESLGDRIQSIPESPTSLRAVIKIGSSSILPLLSLLSIAQFLVLL